MRSKNSNPLKVTGKLRVRGPKEKESGGEGKRKERQKSVTQKKKKKRPPRRGNGEKRGLSRSSCIGGGTLMGGL